ncbi:hypothetical protein Tco_0701899 [Tanacetum coccineum]|uniref:Uncharacterized protein n=1 Tax=Tanacetum coccineum TaxID=301880 RepID=A0ABQ4XUH2_9ASTR
MHSPLTSHFDIALSLLKYLNVAPGSGIQFSKRNSGFNVVALCVSDWAKCLVTRRSVYWYCVFVNGCLVSWKSKKETMAAATCEVMWIVKIMRDLNVNNMIRADLVDPGAPASGPLLTGSSLCVALFKARENDETP